MTEPASTEAEAADSTTIPLFPLGLVLFPGGQLPLKVFEQRYVEMTKSCLRNDSPFGVCLIRHGREVGEPADHETIGCSARITNWEMPHPGLFHLLCSGERVFRVSRTHIEHKSLIVGDVQWLDCKTGEMDSSHFDICRRMLDRPGLKMPRGSAIASPNCCHSIRRANRRCWQRRTPDAGLPRSPGCSRHPETALTTTVVTATATAGCAPGPESHSSMHHRREPSRVPPFQHASFAS